MLREVLFAQLTLWPDDLGARVIRFAGAEVVPDPIDTTEGVVLIDLDQVERLVDERLLEPLARLPAEKSSDWMNVQAGRKFWRAPGSRGIDLFALADETAGLAADLESLRRSTENTTTGLNAGLATMGLVQKRYAADLQEINHLLDDAINRTTQLQKSLD